MLGTRVVFTLAPTHLSFHSTHCIIYNYIPFAYRLLNNAFVELLAFQRALKDLVASVDGTYAKQFEEFFIGLEGSFGSKHVTPRTLTSRLLGSMVCVEGIVTKCTSWLVNLQHRAVEPLSGVSVTKLVITASKLYFRLSRAP